MTDLTYANEKNFLSPPHQETYLIPNCFVVVSFHGHLYSVSTDAADTYLKGKLLL